MIACIYIYKYIYINEKHSEAMSLKRSLKIPKGGNRKSKTNRQHNGQKYKRTNHDLQIIQIKQKIE
jgi:hypothetical protein